MQATAVFPAEPTSVAAARHFARDALAGWGVPRRAIDVTTLLTSELVTNAYRHGLSEACVNVNMRRDAVHVEVHDSGAGGRVVVRPLDVDSDDGRGLLIVHELANRWGSMSGESGTLVWFEVLTDDR